MYFMWITTVGNTARMVAHQKSVEGLGAKPELDPPISYFINNKQKQTKLVTIVRIIKEERRETNERDNKLRKKRKRGNRLREKTS